MDKIICYGFITSYVVTFINFFFYIFVTRNETPLPVFLGNLSYFLLSIALTYGVILLTYNRVRFSKILTDANEKNWNMLRRPDAIKFRSQRNRIELIALVMIFIGTYLGILTCIGLVLEFVFLGEDHYRNLYTMNKPPYSWPTIINCVFNVIIIMWVVNFYTAYYNMTMEIFLVISLNFRVLAADLRGIKVGHNEYITFKMAMKELLGLQRLVNFIPYFPIYLINLLLRLFNNLNELIWSYWMLYIALMFSTLGLYVSIIVRAGSIKEDLAFLTVSLYMFIYLALFCTIGQHVQDSSLELRAAAYECEWYAAPVPFRKLILLLLIRCGRPSKLSCPFFEMNFVLLGKVGLLKWCILS